MTSYADWHHQARLLCHRACHSHLPFVPPVSMVTICAVHFTLDNQSTKFNDDLKIKCSAFNRFPGSFSCVLVLWISLYCYICNPLFKSACLSIHVKRRRRSNAAQTRAWAHVVTVVSLFCVHFFGLAFKLFTELPRRCLNLTVHNTASSTKPWGCQEADMMLIQSLFDSEQRADKFIMALFDALVAYLWRSNTLVRFLKMTEGGISHFVCCLFGSMLLARCKTELAEL